MKTAIFVGNGLKPLSKSKGLPFAIRFMESREELFDLFPDKSELLGECVVFLSLGAADELEPFMLRVESEIPNLFLFTPLIACFDGAVHIKFEPYFSRFDGLLPEPPRPEQIEGIVMHAAAKKRERLESEKRFFMHQAVLLELAEELKACRGGGDGGDADLPPGMYYGTDERGIVKFIGDEVLRILGFSKEEIIGRHFSELISKDELDRMRLAFVERRAGDRRSRDVPVKFKRKDGGYEELIVDARGVHVPSVMDCPGKDPNRVYIGTVGYSKRKTRYDQAIDIFERSLKPIAIYNLSDSTMLVNRGFEEFSGYGQADVLGKTPADFEKPEKSFFGQCVGVLQESRRCIYNTVIVTRACEEHFCEVSLDFVEYEGKRYVIVMYNDVTSLMQLLDEAETLIRLSWDIGNISSFEEMVRTVSEKMASILRVPFFALGFPEDGEPGIDRYYLRSEKRSGWFTRSDALFHDDFEPLVREAIAEKKTIYRSVVDILKSCDLKDYVELKGEKFLVVTPLVVNQGSIGCIIVLHERDSTFTLRGVRLLEISTNVIAAGIYKLRLENELRKNLLSMERRVKERTKELEDFIYTVSHDLKSPLHAARGFADMVQNQFRPYIKDGDDEYMLRRIKENIGEAITMINDLLKLSRIGTQELRFEKVDLNEIIQDYAVQFKALKREDVVLDVAVTRPIPEVLADRTRAVQLFINLFDNSVKYRRGKKVDIEVGAETRGDRVHISIVDNGIGIREEDLKNVMKIFYRVRAESAVQQAEGTGLGLPIVKKIVEQHGGTIALKSEIGKGTTVLFDLPRFLQ
jgi:PAS domain S-box-containing protein